MTLKGHLATARQHMFKQTCVYMQVATAGTPVSSSTNGVRHSR